MRYTENKYLLQSQNLISNILWEVILRQESGWRRQEFSQDWTNKQKIVLQVIQNFCLTVSFKKMQAIWWHQGLSELLCLVTLEEIDFSCYSSVFYYNTLVQRFLTESVHTSWLYGDQIIGVTDSCTFFFLCQIRLFFQLFRSLT